MTQTSAPPSGGEGGGGEGVVDWDAVFRTIDHQQQPGVARVDDQSGTNGLGVGGGGDYPWPQHQHDDGSSQAFIEHYARQMRQNQALNSPNFGHGHANAIAEGSGSSSGRRRTRERESLPAPYSPYDRHPAPASAPITDSPYGHDLPFRAMLRAIEGDPSQHAEGSGSSNAQHGGQVPPPVPAPRARTSGRGRRRSHSLGPRRSASASLPTVPLFTPQPNTYGTQDGYPFTLPSPSLAQSQSGAPDFFSLLSQVQTPHQSHSLQHHQQNGFDSSTTTPAPTPLQTFIPYHNPATASALATPLHSPPSTGNSRHPTHSHSAGEGAGAGTPGAEADSEDKRVRNTLASARFRAKRKAHLAEVEQQINHLEGRSTTLQRQVEDLKKENAFLKEMVQLKYGLDVDKRMGR